MKQILISLLLLSSLGASVQAGFPIQCEVIDGIFDEEVYATKKECEEKCSFRCRSTDGKGNPRPEN